MADETLSSNVSYSDLNEDGTLEEEGSAAKATMPSSGSKRNRFERTYSCDECVFKTMKSKEFLNHQIEAHQKAFSVFSCNKCEYASRYKTKLERHRQRRHSELKDSNVADASPLRSIERGSGSVSGVHRRKSSVVNRIQPSSRKELPAADDDGNVDEQNVEYSSQEQELQGVRSVTVVINGVTMHKCSRCSFASPIRLRTSKHYRQCHQIADDRYICRTCSYRAQSRADFFSHRATHSEKEFLRCPDCDYTTAAKANLDRHYSHHLLDMPHKCTLCSFSSTGEGAVQRHMADHHMSIVSSASLVRPSTALDCGEGGSSDVINVMSQIGKTTPELDVLKRPLSSGDYITPPGAAVSLGCGVCGHGTNSVDDMKTHLASVHGLTASGSRVSRMKNSDKATVIDNVMEAKVDGIDAASEVSSASRAKSASVESGLDAVVKTSEADEAQVLNCRHCSYTAKWPSELKRHERVHLAGKRYVCSDCNKSYKYRGDLASHLRRVHFYRGRVKQLVPVHEAEGSDSDDAGRDEVKPAGRAAAASGQSGSQGTGAARQRSSSSNVRCVPKGGRKLHAWGGGTRRCPACSFSTMFISRLDDHMRSHTFLKPFRCFYCEYASFWRGDVKKHMDRHHPSQMVDVEDAYELIEYTFQMDLRKAELNKSNAALTKESNNASTSSAPSLTKKGARRMKITPMRSWPVEGSPKAPTEPNEAAAPTASSRGVRPYKCSACGLRFNVVSDVQKHFHLAHTSVQDLKIVHLSRDELIQLGESESDVKAYYPSELCNSREGGAAVLSKSKNESGSQLARPFQCSACGKLSRWRSNMSKHVRTVHRGTTGARIITRPAELRKQRDEFAHDKAKDPPEDDRALACSACVYKSNSKVNIRKHIHRAHRGKAKIVLLRPTHQTPVPSIRTEKNKPRAIKAQVGLHRLTKAESLIEPINPKDTTTKWSVAGFKCKLCEFISKWRSALRRHIHTRHGKKATLGLVKSIIMKPRIDRSPAIIPSASASTSTAQEASRMKGVTRSAKAARSVVCPTGAGVAASSVSVCVAGTLPTPGDTVRAITKSEDRMDVRRPANEGGTPTDNERDVPVTQCANAQHMTWLCCLCSFDCGDRATAVDHLQAEHQLCAYRCSLCQFTSDAEAVIENHVLVEHESQSLAEVVSKKWSRCLALVHVKTKESGLSCSTKHALLPDDGRTFGIQYGCTLCDRKTSWKSAAVRHAKEVHGRDPMKSKWPLDTFYKTIGSLPANLAAGGSGAVLGLPTRLPKSPRHDPTVAVDSTSTNDVGRDDGGTSSVDGNSSFSCPGRKHSMKQQHAQSVTKPTVTLDGPKPKRQRIANELSTHELDEPSSPMHDKQDIEEQNGSLRKAKNKAVDVSLLMRRYQCSACPFRCKSSRDLIYHKQFHRPKAAAVHKCPKCKYWVTRRGLLKQHTKVHDPEYAAQFTAGTSGGAPANERGLQSLSSSSDGNASPASSSDTEEASSMQCDSAVELAELKERALKSRIQPVVLLLPVPPEQLRGGMDCDGLTLEHGRKKYKCSSCPYAAHFPSLLTRHEWMHERKRKALRAVMEAKRSGAAEIPSSRVTDHECNLCDFACDDRRTLEQHLYVHSLDFPGFVDEEITTELAKEMQQLAAHASDGAELVSSEGGFNLKYNRNTGEYVLEGSGNVTRYQCEKCPYRSFNMEHFRRHVVLHGSRQRYACRYCDYSVPVFSMVTRHQQLHTSINPNLLTYVKPSNLPLLSFTSADKALLGDTACDPADDFYENRPEDCVAPLENFDTAAKKKLYRCDFCPYANIRKDHIVSHLKCHYIRSQFKCVYCTYSVSQACLINEHIKLHHVPFVGQNGSILPIVLDGETGGTDCVKLVPASEMECEYIDISAMQSEAGNETSSERDQALRFGDRMPPSSGSNVRTCSDLICQYCDRRFESADDHHDHELRHLVSMVRVNDDSDDEA